MCLWVGSHALSCGWQLWGLPSRVEYLSPQGVLLLRVYHTIASPLWFELRISLLGYYKDQGLCEGAFFYFFVGFFEVFPVLRGGVVARATAVFFEDVDVFAGEPSGDPGEEW